VVETYAALGDSFTAAPFVPTTNLASGCFRSTGNYPSLLAERLDARLRDASCSAATSHDVTHRQVFGLGDLRASVPPQLRAVRRGTDLVTVGIGGNDERLFASLVRDGTGVVPRDATAVARRTGDRVARVLRAVRRAAPSATVVLVGYPRLVDPDRGCRDLPVAAADRPALAAVERALNRALSRAADRAGALFLDVHRLSAGHEICAADPWVNGRVTDDGRAAAYHPFPEGQRAVADALLALLRADAAG
jgi:lysophospholipase L1-like esterase